MDSGKASVTALVTAFARRYHSKHAKPPIFDDFLADKLFSQEEVRFFEHNVAQSLSFLDAKLAEECKSEEEMLRGVMRIHNVSTTVSRSRFTEDHLDRAIADGVGQYVILGAGMDTFAYRRPELKDTLQIYEVDHPSTHSLKISKMKAANLEIPQNLHYVPVDFNRESLMDALLNKSTYRQDNPSFFSWLGVTFYLPIESVMETLGAIAEHASQGSTIIFDYMDKDAFNPGKTSYRMQMMQKIVESAGEPMQTGFDPGKLSEVLKSAGFKLLENLSPEQIENAYFKGRSDDYHAFEHIHFARAVVDWS